MLRFLATMIGSKLGSYEIEEEIGRGGMGVVYRANQPKLQRRVAVKVLLPHLAQDAEFVERFLREARAAAQLEHPGLVTIFDVGELEGTYFFSMQWLQGRTLEEKVADGGALPMEEVVGVVSQMAAALGYAHGAGVVHRDVKPANVIVDDRGRAVLTDFGIAQAANETRLTRAGAAVGSPDYMAPEQISGGEVDARTDLYALGVLFYHLLTGETPYSGDAPIAVAYQHLNAPVPSVREKRSEVPPELDEVVRRLLAKAPEDRFQSAEDLLAALQQVPIAAVAAPATGIGPIHSPAPRSEGGAEPGDQAAEEGRRPRRVRPWLAVVAAVVFFGAGVYWGSGRGRVASQGGGGAAEAVPTQVPPESPPEPAPVEPPAPESFSAVVEIQPDQGDLEVWVDGRDQELRTPAELPVEGLVGDALTVELRRDGVVLASLDLILGPEMESHWAPAVAPAEEILTISSQPAGARVDLDGTTLDGVTPLAVAFVPGRDYRLALTLENHEPAGWSFALEDLSAEQRQSGRLHFVLASSIQPGELVVRADYRVTVEIDGRRESGEGDVRLSVPPGSYSVALSAPEVFYSDTRDVVIESEQSQTLELPQTVTIPVAAEGRCRLSIDGRDVGDLPARFELTIGSHEFRFQWEGGQIRQALYNIGLSTQRIFEVTPK
jgi:serine/threonine-protein kinase